jgi:putative transposon-encoded protein
MGKRIQIIKQNEIKITGIQGYFEKTVTPFGSGAKIDCPKQYLGKKAYIIIED